MQLSFFALIALILLYLVLKPLINKAFKLIETVLDKATHYVESIEVNKED